MKQFVFQDVCISTAYAFQWQSIWYNALMREMTNRMTEGSPTRLIIHFALPLMLGNMLQQVYIMTDTLIVSRVLGINALAAVGATDWLSYMMISIVQAVSQGFAIMLAQDFGADDHEHLHKTLAHSIRLALLLTVVITAVALVIMNPLLQLMHTKSELMPMASGYLGVIYAGLPAVMLLNFGSSVLRAFGNSKTPLYAVAISACLNVVLDLLFVAVFDFGVEGAAVATVMAQCIAGLFCLYAISKIEWIAVKKEHFGKEKGLDWKLFSLSWPMMIQNMIIALGGLVVQSQVNQYDISFISGYTATNKIYGLLEMAAIAYGFAMVTYIGQNYGAHLVDRIKKGIKDACIVAVITSAIIAVCMLLFGRFITGMFLTGNGADVVEAGNVAYKFLVIMSLPLPVLYILYIARSSLQGFGDTVNPMVSGIAECVTRILIALFAVNILGSTAMLIAEPAAWFAAMILLIGALIKRIRDLDKTSA